MCFECGTRVLDECAGRQGLVEDCAEAVEEVRTAMTALEGAQACT